MHHQYEGNEPELYFQHMSDRALLNSKAQTDDALSCRQENRIPVTQNAYCKEM